MASWKPRRGRGAGVHPQKRLLWRDRIPAYGRAFHRAPTRRDPERGVEGYSRLMGDDEVATVRAITEYRAVIASTVTGHGGRAGAAPGDNSPAEFSSVVDAVQCAADIQRQLEARNAEL